jgi:hypothetical protein
MANYNHDPVPVLSFPEFPARICVGNFPASRSSVSSPHAALSQSHSAHSPLESKRHIIMMVVLQLSEQRVQCTLLSLNVLDSRNEIKS